MRPYIRTLPFDAWPDDAKQAWIAIPAGLWTPEYRKRMQQSCGRFLKFLADSGRPFSFSIPRAVAEDYRAALLASNSAQRASDLFEKLFYVMRALCPSESWSWLRTMWLSGPGPKRASPRVPKPRESRVTVLFSEWPKAHQALWRAFFPEKTEDVRVALRGPRPLWEERTQAMVEDAYSQYLHAVRRAGLPDLVSSEGIKCYVQELQRRNCRLQTIFKTVGRAYRGIRWLEPKQDWSWLRLSVKRLKARAMREGRKLKHGRIIHPAKIYLRGLRYINRARRLRDDDYQAANLFCTGLLMCMLASVPVRIGNIAATVIGIHLDLEKGTLVYDEDETKEDREDAREIPEELLALIREWIHRCRNRFVRDPNCKALWVSDQGRAITTGALSRRFSDVMEEKFQVRVTPHIVRDCVATMIKEEHPEERELASIILNHASRETTRIYQDQARALSTQRKAREIMESAQAKLRRDLAAG
jgi:integrase